MIQSGEAHRIFFSIIYFFFFIIIFNIFLEKKVLFVLFLFSSFCFI